MVCKSHNNALQAMCEDACAWAQALVVEMGLYLNNNDPLCPICFDRSSKAGLIAGTISGSTALRVKLESQSECFGLEYLWKCPNCESKFGEHKQGWLDVNNELKQFLDTVVFELLLNHGYLFEDACSAVEQYHVSFKDPEFCRRRGSATQDLEFLKHEGAEVTAARVHYYLKIED